MKDDEIIEFRKLWIDEVTCKPKNEEGQGRSALQLWVEGNEMERQRNTVKAIKLYRMAIKLDPEVEKKYLELASRKNAIKNDMVLQDEPVEKSAEEVKEEERMDQNSKFLSLPPEIHVQIFKFLAVLSTNSIFNISISCKQMSLTILTESIWRFACNYYHDVDVDEEVSKYNFSFLNMWILKPRIRYDGVYVSTIKYQREGMSDPSLRLANLKTLHIVTYYRYKRFFPDNTCLIYTASTEPRFVIPELKTSSKLGFILGHWRWEGDNVVVNWNGVNDNSTIMTAILKIFSTVKGLNNRLHWIELIEKNEGEGSSFSFPRTQLVTLKFTPYIGISF